MLPSGRAATDPVLHRFIQSDGSGQKSLRRVRHTREAESLPDRGNAQEELKHKLGECVWWLAILAHELDLDLAEATQYFLSKAEKI